MILTGLFFLGNEIPGFLPGISLAGLGVRGLYATGLDDFSPGLLGLKEFVFENFDVSEYTDTVGESSNRTEFWFFLRLGEGSLSIDIIEELLLFDVIDWN